MPFYARVLLPWIAVFRTPLRDMSGSGRLSARELVDAYRVTRDLVAKK